MMMTIQRVIQGIRDRVHAFLGIDSLATRLEIIQMRDDQAKYHREVMDSLARITLMVKSPETPTFKINYRASNLSWEQVQAIELAQMLQNPPKED